LTLLLNLNLNELLLINSLTAQTNSAFLYSFIDTIIGFICANFASVNDPLEMKWLMRKILSTK